MLYFTYGGVWPKNQNYGLKMHFNSFESFVANVIFLLPPTPHPALGGWGDGLFDYSFYPALPFEILNSQRLGIPSFHL